MRSKAAERARFTWLTTQGFADAIGVQRAQVLAMIHAGWFEHRGAVPECMNVALPDAKKPEYRIHPDALKRFYRERGASKRTDGEAEAGA